MHAHPVTKVFEIGASLEDDRPEINFSASKEANNNWASLEEPFGANGPLVVVVDHPLALEWDCYACGGAPDLLSARAVDVIGREALSGFKLLPASLNGAPYFSPICVSRLDCLDRRRSVLAYFPTNAGKVMSIRKYEFLKNKLSKCYIFSIQESNLRRFATPSIKRSIEVANLKGFRFTEVWSASVAAKGAAKGDGGS